MRRMSDWAVQMSPQGPVALGYRLGHIRGDSRVFRALVYNKSAVVLHMLRRLLGDDAFFRGLRRFYFDWRFRKASTKDVRDAFEAESHRPLGRFFDGWILGSGLPQLKTTWTASSNPETVQVRIEQIGQVFELPLTVTLVFVDGATMDHLVALTGQVTEVGLPASRPVRRVEFNRDGLAPVRLSQ
jgi:aminopeptidase N